MQGEYARHAAGLDRQFHPGAGTPGPVAQRLQSFTTTRGVVFGQYAEVSADVHDLVDVASTRLAEQQWRLAGARSVDEMRSFIVSRSRRRIGLATAQAFARHRIARAPYIGVPRRMVVAHMQQTQQLRQHGVVWGQRLYAPAPSHSDFFSYQVAPPGGAAGPAGG